jgi:ATP-dependent helicase Lhr and Lhr-like helicase
VKIEEHMIKGAKKSDPFHPLVSRWFRDRLGRPTDVQERAWPKIAAGEHVLISAPTGTGKTLAAFLWALNQLITGVWPAGGTRVLYISPLRALNYDIQRNLLQPLAELRELFESKGETFPEIRVLTRSGDTSQDERRRMLRHPPEILITTPESLNLLLSSRGGRSILNGVSTVILDEIHAVVGNKRGVHLITAVERLTALSGEFQRIALSATIRPLETVADFVGGFRMQGPADDPGYVPRPVCIVVSAVKKKYDLQLRFPEKEGDPGNFWGPIAGELKEIILRNRSTLIFVNSRRLCETLTLRINEGEKEPIAYAHHGSLSLEIRREVERRLKAGELRAIVATHSLELGIDIGALDEVVLVQSPFSISSAIQRLGRAGHRVGEVSRGTLFPTHPADLLEAAVLVPEIIAQDIEEARPVLTALDVLAQVVVSMVGVETWKIDALYSALKASYPYRHLSRRHFDLVLNMLAGRYAHSRIRELSPRVSIDRLDGTVAARKGALQALYSSGGVIPDRGYFHLRHAENRARIGELDEEFVWEADVGDIFALGTQHWQVRQITHNEVLVLPARPREAAAPFWKAEENGRDFHFSERIASFLEDADGSLEDPDFPNVLQEVNRMEPSAAQELVDFLLRQRTETGCGLPHRHRLVVEYVSSGPGGAPGNMVVIHTLWGGRVNRPWAMALDAAWEARFGHRLEFYIGNDSIVLLGPHKVRAEELLFLAGSAEVEPLLRKRLEGSGFFGARFRECAGRALLLTKSKWGERMPLWLSRLQSQKLLDAVLRFEDFPILLETWRTCLREEFDLESLKRLLTELESGALSWTEAHTSHPSPFARSDWWGQVNQYMYMGDELKGEKSSRIRADLIRELALQPGLRPTISRDQVLRFEKKRQRLIPGYSPQDARDLLDWVQERVMIPLPEWEELLEAMARDHGTAPESLLTELKEKLVKVYPPGSVEPLVSGLESLDRRIAQFYGAEQDVGLTSITGDPIPQKKPGPPPLEAEGEDWPLPLGEWLRFYGPTTSEFLLKTLGMKADRLHPALEDLSDAQKIVRGQLVTGGDPDEICDRENFEMLLRLARAESRPVFEPLEMKSLPLFLAAYQGIANPQTGLEALKERVEQLLGYPAEAAAWETEIFPARLQPYDPSWLDTLMQEEDLEWIGAEGHRIAFCFGSDLDLLREDIPGEAEWKADEDRTPEVFRERGRISVLFPDPNGRYDFSTLLRYSHMAPPALAEKLWDAVWRGEVTNDAFIPLRRAVLQKYKVPELTPAEGRSSRRWSRHRPGPAGGKERRFSPGNWHLLSSPESSGDLLDAEERKKDRVRLLLDRYGILFREVLLRELPPLSWPGVFRSLRIMELSGEVFAGYFFTGIPGPQFISPRALRILQRKLPEDPVYWMNAADPASLCGVPVDSLRGALPPRLPGTHLVFRGTRLVMVSKRNGKDLTFNAPPDDPDFPEYLGALRHLLTRKFQPLRRIAVETINGEDAPQSPYVAPLRACFEVLVDYKYVNLSRKVG